MNVAEVGQLSLEIRGVTEACARGVARVSGALAEHEVVMLWAVHDERAATLQALTKREAETRAGQEALAADRAALDSEIGAM